MCPSIKYEASLKYKNNEIKFYTKEWTKSA